LREAPWIMTGPLVILGILSAAGGVLVLRLSTWLEPVTRAARALAPEHELSRHTEWTLAGIAVLVALAGMVGAWRLLDPARLVPARQSPPERGLGRLLWKKYYVDEIYQAVIVRPIVWFSREVLWHVVDEDVIDGIGVNGVARLSRAAGWIGSRLQNGELGFYVMLFVVGVVLVLGATVR